MTFFDFPFAFAQFRSFRTDGGLDTLGVAGRWAWRGARAGGPVSVISVQIKNRTNVRNLLREGCYIISP